ncbi:MAG: hypothetical protein EOM12_16050 [Verrucomicrobiae bacterium]|nr:hypothetical protein [Verrucomicrobiae bacterium]
MNKKGDAVTAFVLTVAFCGAILAQGAIKGQLAKPSAHQATDDSGPISNPYSSSNMRLGG